MSKDYEVPVCNTTRYRVKYALCFQSFFFKSRVPKLTGVLQFWDRFHIHALVVNHVVTKMQLPAHFLMVLGSQGTPIMQTVLGQLFLLPLDMYHLTPCKSHYISLSSAHRFPMMLCGCSSALMHSACSHSSLLSCLAHTRLAMQSHLPQDSWKLNLRQTAVSTTMGSQQHGEWYACVLVDCESSGW